MLSIALVPAKAQVIVYVSLDKVQYEPGGEGTISIVIRNLEDEPIQVYNVTVEFHSWMMYTVDGWDELGNQTIDYSHLDQYVGIDESVALDDVKFNVPTDGRATSTIVYINIHTTKGILRPEPKYVSVIGLSTQHLQRAMDNIVTLLTVTAILAIVSAIIIAAAVFLSARRPSTMWKKEE